MVYGEVFQIKFDKLDIHDTHILGIIQIKMCQTGCLPPYVLVHRHEHSSAKEGTINRGI